MEREVEVDVEGEVTGGWHTTHHHHQTGGCELAHAMYEVR